MALGRLYMDPDFKWMAASLKSLMEREDGEARGNLGLLVLAVHAVIRSSGVKLSDERDAVFPDQSPPPPSLELRYSFSSPGIDGTLDVEPFVVGFHQSSGDLVTVTATSCRAGEGEVHRAAFDMGGLAGPLISCARGAVGGAEEAAISRFWKEVNHKLCYRILINALLHWDRTSPPPPEMLRRFQAAARSIASRFS